MYTYTLRQWLAFFYIYCFFGWMFESAYVSLKTGHFVNRGFLRIPMLPLYGSGAVMMLWVSLPVRDHLSLVYISGVVAATALEYVTGAVMEQLFKIRYWDYSSQRFQLHGYICLTSSIAWGFLTILMTEVIHQPVEGLILQADQNILLFLVALTSIIFVLDGCESTKEALALGKSLETLTRLREEAEELGARITALKEEAAEQLADIRLSAAERIIDMKSETAERISVKLSLLHSQLEETKKKQSILLHHSKIRRFYHWGLLKGNPGAVSIKFADALKELKEHMKHPDKDRFNE